MKDLDTLLPYVLRKRNIAYIDQAALFIGDRRVFPFERSFVRCDSVQEVASAIRAMVTQGGGPLQVALTTLQWLAQKGVSDRAQYDQACAILKASRPTNTTMARTLDGILDLLPSDVVDPHAVLALVAEREQYFDSVYERMGRLGSSLLKDGDVVLTTCFAEHTLLLSLLFAKEEGKDIVAFVPETRPYFQGARLTAPSLEELGIPVRLITDGMGAHFMEEGTITKYMTAADLVCRDGTVVNKTGTLANVVCAHEFNIPYHVFSMSPDLSRSGRLDIVMEERDGSEVTHSMGQLTTSDSVVGLYPAFDIIPAKYVTSIVTSQGIFTSETIGEELS